MTKFKLFLVITIFIISQSALAQKAPNREWAIFNKGVRDYKNQKYVEAEKNFRTVLAKLYNGKLTTANYLMLAKTIYKNGEYQASLDSCRSFIKKFPDSKFRDDMLYLQANNYFRLNRPQTAVTTWLYVAEKSTAPRLAKKSLELAEQVSRFRLQKADLINLKRENKTDFAKQVILYYLAEKYYEEGNHKAALSMLNELQKLNVSGSLIDNKVNQLSSLLNHNKKKMIRIAALLPLSGSNGEVGKAILDGARMAVDEFNRQRGPVLELVPFDYETRLLTAIQKFKEIAADASISAVFGPVENDITTACTAITGYEEILLITPTSTESQLRRLSANVVQLSIPQDITARKLARFAQDSLHLKRFASITPIDDYFLNLSKLFMGHIKEAGGEIVSEQWYYPENQNVTNYFKSIKRDGLKQAYRDSLMQSDSTITVHLADSLYAIYLETEQKRLRNTHTKLDSADIPVISIDAIFAPIYKTDISLIASQFAYWNIQAQLLGNEDWYDIQSLKKNKSYINGLIFISGGYLNEENWDYKKFRNNFRTTFKRTPEKFEIIGFDSFNFILSTLEDKSVADVNRENFIRFLQEAPLYRGIYRNFNIGEKRFNNAARILKYSYGQILPLQ